MIGVLNLKPSCCPGTPLKGHMLRHRRGKSETLRVQYINTKDVRFDLEESYLVVFSKQNPVFFLLNLHLFFQRVTVGTWNVAGRLPYDDLELDEWLCMKEPADIYILG